MKRVVIIISISALCLSVLGQKAPIIEKINLKCVNPVYIITDDFNRDGYPDLAVACHSCDAIAAIPNRARNPVPKDQPQECNQFIDGEAVYWELNDSPVALDSGMFIGPPVAGAIPWTAAFPNIAFVTQFLPGAGRFSPIQPTVPFLRFVPGNINLNRLQEFATLTHMVLDDFNNDGDVDLAVLDGLTPQIGVYLSTRNTMGSVLGPANPLSPPTKLSFPATLNIQPTTKLAYGFVSASFMVSADFDRDGWKDLAIAVGGSIVIYRNVTGAFANPTAANVNQNAFTQPYQSSFHQIFVLPQLGVGITGMTVADFNRDGYIDIAAVDPQFGALIIIWNKGCWSFSYQRIKKDGGPYFVTVLDCDRNGLPDIAVAERDADRVQIILTRLKKDTAEISRPDRCDRAVARPEYADQVEFIPAFAIPVGPAPVGLAIADYDRNGMEDIAVVLSKADGTPEPDSTPEAQVIYNPCCCPLCENGVPCCDGEVLEPAEKECGKEGDTKKGQ